MKILASLGLLVGTLALATVLMGETVLNLMFPYTPPDQIASVPAPKRLPDDVSMDVGPNQGKHFPKHISVDVDGKKTKLTLTGVLTRKKQLLFTFDIYHVACYTQVPLTGDVYQMLEDLVERDQGIKAYVVSFAKRAPASIVKEEIEKEINIYFPPLVVTNNQESINAFVGQLLQDAWMPYDSKVYVLRLPGGIVYSKYQDSQHLNFIGEDLDFAKAIWNIWAGEHSGDDRYGLVDLLAPKPAE